MENDPFETDQLRRLRQRATARIEDFAKEVISFLKSEPSRLAPENLGLRNTWEEYAIQISGEESIDFEDYRDIVRDLAQGVASAAPRKDIELCALFSEAYVDWWSDQDDPVQDALSCHIVEWLVDDIEQAVNRHAEEVGEVINDRIRGEFSDARTFDTVAYAD